VTASESSIENIALNPYHKPELTFLSQLDADGSITWTMDDYVCSPTVRRVKIYHTDKPPLGMLRRWKSAADWKVPRST
jgi:hypothetical protein